MSRSARWLWGHRIYLDIARRQIAYVHILSADIDTTPCVHVKHLFHDLQTFRVREFLKYSTNRSDGFNHMLGTFSLTLSASYKALQFSLYLGGEIESLESTFHLRSGQSWTSLMISSVYALPFSRTWRVPFWDGQQNGAAVPRLHQLQAAAWCDACACWRAQQWLSVRSASSAFWCCFQCLRDELSDRVHRDWHHTMSFVPK